MKKIVVAIPSFRIGGAERFMINLVNNLDDRKFDKTLLVINGEGAYKSLVKPNIKIIDLKKNRVSKSKKQIVEVINQIEPDFIVSTLVHLNLTILGLKKKFKNNPKIIVREATNILNFINKDQKLKRLFYKLAINKFYIKSHKVVMQCNGMKEKFINDFSIPESKLETIYNPVDIEFINKKSLEPVTDVIFEDDKINLISVGRLSDEKDFPSLLKAIEILKNKKKVYNIKLNIIGDGPNRDSIEKLISDLNLTNEVQLLGFKDNPYKYIKSSDIFVLPSKIEGFPNVLLEALTCGIKIVSTDCETGPREILLNDIYGNLCKVGDPGSIAAAILESHKNNNLSKNRSRDFSIKEIISEYEKMLEN